MISPVLQKNKIKNNDKGNENKKLVDKKSPSQFVQSSNTNK